MLGNLYDRALAGERCWVRHDDGSLHRLPVGSWLGGRHADSRFDRTVVGLCTGPTIDLGCGPGRLVARLIERGIPALGVDLSATAIDIALRNGVPALRRDVFDPLPGAGRWQTVLLADGNVGLGGNPWRILRRSAQLLSGNGDCLVEFDAAARGIALNRVRLESSHAVGPWFRWATVGADCIHRLADDVGLAVAAIHPIGSRVVASLVAR